ncbi:MAG: arginase family protein [Gammaproteobacteria bacterium]|nr:arginase family protein [Gammaproteobacteria bacterium]
MTRPAAHGGSASWQHTTRPAHPFLGWPVVLEPAKWNADVAILGITHSEPYAHDEQPNEQTRAPDAVRACSERFCYGGGTQFDWDLDTELAAVLPPCCIDCGNAVREDEPYDDYSARVTAYLEVLWRRGTLVLVLGGDHGVTIPALDALAVLDTRVHIVHIDAHLDWREEVEGVRRGYSSPLRWASTKPYVAGMTQIGLRGVGSARAAEAAAARAYGSRIFTASQVHAAGIEPVLAAVPANLPLYITVDADGLDPAVMPGVMAPAPGGLRFDQIAALLRALASRQRVVGMDLVEIAPRFDAHNAVTCITAGCLLVTLLGAQFQRPQPRA